MLVASYCRVSTDSKDQNNSYENQQSYFQREIVAKGHELFGIYADKGLTGTKLNNRPEFEKMLSDAGIDVKVIDTNVRDKRLKNRHTFYELSDRKPLFDEIWMKNTSRFARNTLSYEIINLLRQKKVNLYFLEQNINSNDMAQDMLLKLFQVFDEQDSKDKSLKVRTGNAEGAKKGVVRTNGKIYGYHYIQHENRLDLIPKEAETIKLIFELYISGKGTRQILNYLESNKIYTRFGKPFCKSSVRRILDNEKYAGINNPLKYDTGIVMQKLTYAKVKDEYDTADSDRIPAIIDKETFYKCREILKSKVNHSNQTGVYKGISKYSGMIYCGSCGGVYYSNQDRGRPFYNCSTKKMRGTINCNNPNVSEKSIDEYIQALANHSLSLVITKEKERATNIIFNIIKLKLSQIDEDRTEKAQDIQKQIEDTEQQLSGYYELYARQTANKVQLLDKIGIIENELQSLNQIFNETIKGNEHLKADIIDLWNLHSQIIDVDYNKGVYTFDETFNMIQRMIIKSTDKGFDIESPILRASEIDALISKYKKDASFKPLTKIEYQEILDKIGSIIPFS